MKSTLTNKEKEMIAKIVQDNESGHHLLYLRDKDYNDFRVMLGSLMKYTDTEYSEHDKEMLDYYKACQSPENMEIYKKIYIQ